MYLGIGLSPKKHIRAEPYLTAAFFLACSIGIPFGLATYVKSNDGVSDAVESAVTIDKSEGKARIHAQKCSEYLTNEASHAVPYEGQSMILNKKTLLEAAQKGDIDLIRSAWRPARISK